MKMQFKGGGSAPPPPATPVAPANPDANEEAKQAAAEAKSRANRRARAGTMNQTLATGPEGALGSAPTNTPSLKSTLGA